MTATEEWIEKNYHQIQSLDFFEIILNLVVFNLELGIANKKMDPNIKYNKWQQKIFYGIEKT